MSSGRLLVAPLVAAALVGCAALREPEILVDHEFDRQARFEGRRTFEFLVEPGSAPRDERIDAELFAARVQRAVLSVLEERGFERDIRGRPDFLIAHYGLLDTGRDIQNFVDIDVYSYRTWAQPMRIQQIPLEYDQGMLILDIIDPATRALMWRGYGETRVDLEASAGERAGRLREVVAAMMASFPPRRSAPASAP